MVSRELSKKQGRVNRTLFYQEQKPQWLQKDGPACGASAGCVISDPPAVLSNPQWVGTVYSRGSAESNAGGKGG